MSAKGRGVIHLKNYRGPQMPQQEIPQASRRPKSAIDAMLSDPKLGEWCDPDQANDAASDTEQTEPKP